ncbi:MAG TPA: hypothetical protein PKI93_01025 [Alphaproteobacteria bacterium]|nr:hypothetical protein [Alphaproteobacteria bacterium]HNS44420.1 hypothetical protein [Alphaproteobacteria bacterium]
MIGISSGSLKLVALLGGALLFLLSAPSWADDKKEAGQKKEDTPLTRLDEATKVMTADLNDNQALQFNAIETSYRTIRAVEDVQMSVTRAVDACGKKNPDIKDDMDKRLREWKDALRPTMKDANNKLDKMILLQDFSAPSRVRKYLKMFDEAILYRNQGVESVPVTEKDQCLKLKDTMSDTQKELVKLLNETLGLDKPLNTTEEQ